MLLFELQPFFKRVRIRLVDFIAEIGFLNPRAGCVHAQHGIARGYLFDTDNNFHLGCSLCYSANRLKMSAPLVPPNPNELDSAQSMRIGRAWLGT